MPIKIEITEDVKDTSEKSIIAKKGRQGTIDESDYNHYGVGENRKHPHFLYTLLEGNKVRRTIPNWTMKRVDGK